MLNRRSIEPCWPMMDEEMQVTKQFSTAKHEWRISVNARFGFRISSFLRHSCFVIRHFVLLAALFDSLLAAENPIAQPAATNSIVVPFEFRRDHVMVRVSVNRSQPLLFMLDTG